MRRSVASIPFDRPAKRDDHWQETYGQPALRLQAGAAPFPFLLRNPPPPAGTLVNVQRRQTGSHLTDKPYILMVEEEFLLVD